MIVYRLLVLFSGFVVGFSGSLVAIFWDKELRVLLTWFLGSNPVWTVVLSNALESGFHSKR